MKNCDKKHAARRVVVTGLGVVSSIGIGWEMFWQNLIKGESRVSKITSFDTLFHDRHVGSEIRDFQPERFINKTKIPKLGRASQMAIAASKLAIGDAKFSLDESNRNEVAVCIGTTGGEIQLLENFNDCRFFKLKRFNNYLIPSLPWSSLASIVAQELKLTNQVCSFATACAAGNYAIGQAFDLIKSGKVDYALAGGADAISRIAFTGFGRLFAVAPEKCQPFDKNRRGLLPGEGSGMIFLETLESAKKRGALIYAEILNYGLSCDGHHMTTPSVDGVAKAMRKAILNSHIHSSDVDYINAHGTGTRENDRVECQAINRVFGTRAEQIPVSSIKSILGHAMGAASALEAIACCLAIKNNQIPATINFSDRDDECDIDCVPNESRKRDISVVINNAQAFGGNNSCLIVGAF